MKEIASHRMYPIFQNPASSGGFSSRSTSGRSASQRSASRQSAARQAPAARQDVRNQRSGSRQDAVDNRQDYRSDVRKDRQDHVDDRWDNHYRYRRRAAFATGVAVGAVASSNYVTNLSCTPTVVVVNNMTYYNCNSNWYTRGNVSGNVVYIVATVPAGY